MAAKKKEQQEDDTEKTVSSNDLVLSYLKSKDNADHHYNFVDDVFYKTSSSSLLLDLELGGGLPPGCHRLMGPASAGKTSAALSFALNFIKKPKRKVMYIKSEGRLSPEVQSRAGLTFVKNPEDWEDGTCLVIESNVFEFVFGLIRNMVMNNGEKYQYMWIIDSADAMIRKEDLDKPFEDADRVAGAGLIQSTFFKKMSLALAKYGHTALFISQYRQSIKINQYEKSAPKQGSSSGGSAIQHYVDYALDFQERFGGDLIREGVDGKGKIIGHYCKISIEKSNNEKNKVQIRYPIKYGRVGGKSVWVELELRDLMLQWEFLYTKGPSTWLNDEVRQEILEKTGVEVPEKFVGMKRFDTWFEETPAVVDFFFEKFKGIILG